MISELLLRTEKPYLCRMSCRITNRTIFTWLIKIGMTSCPQSKSKIIGKGQHQDQEDYNLERSIILTAMNLFGVFKRRGLVMVYKSKSKSKRHTSITVKSAIVYFSRRQEFLSKSICRMSMKTVLESVPTRSSSRMYWEDLYEVGTMLWHCIQSLNIDRRRSWRLLRKNKYFIAFPRITAPAMNWKISRISGISLPRNATIISVTIQATNHIPTPPLSKIATEIKNKAWWT